MNFNALLFSLAFIAQLFTLQPETNPPFTSLNSEFDEINPVITPDGKRLFVTLANHPKNIAGKKDPGDIWVSSLQSDNKWSQPVHAGSLLNSRGFNSIAGFSADGREMYLLTHYDVSGGTPRTQGIAVSRFNGREWSQPENISIPYFQNKSTSISGYISPDKQYFVFSAETYGSYGVDDIYVCLRKQDGTWSEPKNVGAGINTQYQELSPSLSADGKTLYFSSNGRKGLGSFDVFSATRLDDSWTTWSEPANLGSKINTEGRDLYYREYPALGYAVYTSTKNSDGYGDVRQFTPEVPFPTDSATIVQIIPTNTRTVEPIANPTNKNAVTVFGKVANSKTGEMVPAKITFESVGDKTMRAVLASPPQGYSLDVSATGQYRIRIEATGYISTLENLDIKTFEMQNLEMNFSLQPIEVGTTVNLSDVLFEQSKTMLLPQSYDELDMVVEFLKANPKVRIELAGHTDNRGIPAQNVKLSQARVDKVKEYLVSKGIDSKRVTGKGYGGSKPVANNDDEETRRLNRRVEFTILRQ